MKKLLLPLLIMIIALSVWWFNLRTPPYDPHYDAAVCVALDMPGPLSKVNDFSEKVRTVIINENSAWSLKQVSYNGTLAHASIARYQALSDEAKSEANKSIDSCITMMAEARR